MDRIAGVLWLCRYSATGLGPSPNLRLDSTARDPRDHLLCTQQLLNRSRGRARTADRTISGLALQFPLAISQLLEWGLGCGAATSVLTGPAIRIRASDRS